MYNSIERGTSNFMGRLCNALLRITDYRTTVYATECLGWYLMVLRLLKLFTFLNSSVAGPVVLTVCRRSALCIFEGVPQ